MEKGNKLKMEISDKKSCSFQGRVFPEESHVCAHTICIVCRNGEWEEMEVDQS
jgi:hypothetical protein